MNDKKKIDIIKTMQENTKGYLVANRYFLLLVGIAGVADTISTIMFMVQSGPDAEFHPAIRIVSWFLGPVIGPILGKLCQFAAIILITIYFKRWAKYIFLAVFILYTWAAWYNIWGHQIYNPRIFKLIPSW